MKNTKKTFSKSDGSKFLKKMELQRLHKKLKMELRFDPENQKLKKEYDRICNLLKPKSNKRDLLKFKHNSNKVTTQRSFSNSKKKS